MNKYLLFFVIFIILNKCKGDIKSSSLQIKAAEDVLTRILGYKKSSLFNLYIDNTTKNDGFTVIKTPDDTKVSVSGPNAISLVWGVGFYLKNFCNVHISWDGDQLRIPVTLPVVNISVNSVEKFRYYQNVCTSSYSFVWWDWNRWEREIDWMAINGINLALAFTGQEAIWKRTYDALGLSYDDFTGPAFLAWNRMGNVRNFSYGLTNNWLQQQLLLQHKILDRLRELGITPVLPSFCGIVPRSFKDSYPFAKLLEMPKWNKFSRDYCCPYLLDSNDPLFSVVSRVFLKEYINEFGTNHIYNCDVFNENKPASENLDYLSTISSTIYKAMSSVDPKATWLVQGWMFIDPFWASLKRVKAFINAVPKGRMLILDLQSDLTPQYKRLQSYFGQPFIWCTLHNFGGQLGMYGHLNRVNLGVFKGRKFKNSTMVGIGIAPEGIDQNYIMYDFTLDLALRTKPVDLDDWITKYALRRYGLIEKNILDAWLILKNTLYNYNPDSNFRLTSSNVKMYTLVKGEHIAKNILTKFPSLRMNEFTWYNRSIILDIFEKFQIASSNSILSTSSLFQHDLIDVTRQTIQIAIGELYFKIIKQFVTYDKKNFQEDSNMFLELLNELDTILNTGKKFLLGNWLESAKNMATNKLEKDNYEFNARNQITLWGSNGEIRDYAAKQWAGMIHDFYKPRWKLFFQALNESIVYKIPLNYSAVKEKIFLYVEKPFGNDRKIYSTNPQGNAIDVIIKFNEKWRDKLYKIFNK